MAKAIIASDSNKTAELSLADIKIARKRDALALAHLIYDLYKEEQASDNIDNGQNNANQPKNN